MFKIREYNQIHQVEILLSNNGVRVHPSKIAFIEGHCSITDPPLPWHELIKAHFNCSLTLACKTIVN